jgi:hypothetical protein
MGSNSLSLGGKYQETVFRNLHEWIHVCVLLLHCNEYLVVCTCTSVILFLTILISTRKIILSLLPPTYDLKYYYVSVCYKILVDPFISLVNVLGYLLKIRPDSKFVLYIQVQI